MLSIKRLLYLLLAVAVIGTLAEVVNSLVGTGLPELPVEAPHVPERSFIARSIDVDEGDRPAVHIYGPDTGEPYASLCRNVQDFCQRIHLETKREQRFDPGATGEKELHIFCDTAISRYADPEDLAECVAAGGRVVMSAGLQARETDRKLLKVLGIEHIGDSADFDALTFEQPLFPMQPEDSLFYDGESGSTVLATTADAEVYIRDAESDVPVLFTNSWEHGSTCVINGLFLKHADAMGLLTGAMGTVFSDFVYPVVGVKAIFLDNFPLAPSLDNDASKTAYGYSADGFMENVVWPAFQGHSLWYSTPPTASILIEAPATDDFAPANERLLSSVGASVLRSGGELIYAAREAPGGGRLVVADTLVQQMADIFPDYEIQGLAVEEGQFSPDMCDVPGSDISFVRVPLARDGEAFSCTDGITVFPEATNGDDMERGGLFRLYSVLGAYGMVSHVFDVNALTATDGITGHWDVAKDQLRVFESDILSRVAWLEPRTLAQTGDDVRSYTELAYGFEKDGDRLLLHVSGAATGQPFMYHTKGRIVSAEGASCTAIGNGYYMLRIDKADVAIVIEEAS